MRNAFPFSVFALIAAAPVPALAHLGHVGEAAGHSHWIGLAALGVAAAILALLPRGKRKEDEATGETTEAEGDTQDAGAEA